jgi:hypothetical protein
MIDKEKVYQAEQLNIIFNGISHAPGFRMHKRFLKKFPNSAAYISFNDVLHNKFIIRARPIGSYELRDSEDREIIAEYESMDHLVNAGWILD